MRLLLMASLLVALAPAGALAQAEAPTGTTSSAPAQAAPAPAALPPDAPTPAAAPTGIPAYEEPTAGQLVSGAPLNDPNVAVHVVERKSFVERGRHELALYPAAVQTNIRFTEHVGTALTYVYHLHENFGLQLSGQYNWYTNESAFNRELITKVREEAQAASSLLLVWGAQGGMEVTPLYGKFTFYDGTLGRFTLVLNGGVGAGGTRHQLRPEVGGRSATYGDTGIKLLGAVGGGLRFQIGDHFALRLELRDLVYTARVDRVNGCGAADLSAMNDLVSTGAKQLGGNVAVSPGCRVSRFDGVDPRTGESRVLDVPLAKALVDTPTSDALNNVGFYAGFAYVF